MEERDNRLTPIIDDDQKGFWEGLKRHKFTLFRCKKCGAWYWPPAFCVNHQNDPLFGNMEWAEATGKGRVFTFNIHYRAFDPYFKDKLPYVLAQVELDEGPLFASNVIGCDPKEVYVGMPVEVVFHDISREFTLPKFQPVRTKP